MGLSIAGFRYSPAEDVLDALEVSRELCQEELVAALCNAMARIERLERNVANLNDSQENK